MIHKNLKDLSLKGYCQEKKKGFMLINIYELEPYIFSKPRSNKAKFWNNCLDKPFNLKDQKKLEKVLARKVKRN